ncbi:hypothetical protein SDJN02_24491 [Cucurbita argyrosperma subsp. argyrosperma]|nr:hypothetical protein SDJN02_24491 [Cucurbita argyrosperma subsp. argyrosperma]
MSFFSLPPALISRDLNFSPLVCCTSASDLISLSAKDHGQRQAMIIIVMQERNQVVPMSICVGLKGYYKTISTGTSFPISKR